MDQIKIGEYIKKNRKEKKLTQQQLADILHTTNKAVSKWERGVCLFTIRAFSQAAECQSEQMSISM